MENLNREEKKFLLEEKNALCQIKSGKMKGFGFFAEIDERYIPFSDCLITSTKILDENDIKNKKEIKLDFQDSEIILELKERKFFSNKDLGYMCIEIVNDDEINDFLYTEGRIEKEGRETFINKDIFIPKYENNQISFESGKIISFEKEKLLHNCSLKKDSIGAPVISPDIYFNVIGIQMGYNANTKSYIVLPFIDMIKNILYNINPIAFSGDIDIEKEDLSEKLLEILKYYPKIDENSFLSIIQQKFNEKKIQKIAIDFAKYLKKLDIYEEYQKELINNYSCKTKIIFDSNKDEDTYINFMSKVYGKSKLTCFYNFFFPDDYDKTKKTESRNLVFLNGKMESKNNNFEFEHSDVFIFGTFGNVVDEYEFLSYRAQNSTIFYKIKDGIIYAVFYNSYGETKYVRYIVKILNNFMKNKIQYIVDHNYTDLVSESFEKNNSLDNIDELFENCDNSLKNEVDFKELIVYQIDN